MLTVVCSVICKKCQKRSQRAFSHYYVPNVEIKDLNVLIDGERFFDLPVKDEKEAQEKTIQIIKNNDSTTGSLLDFAYSKAIAD